MMAVLRRNDISNWRKTYLKDLQAVKLRTPEQGEANKVATFPRLA
jgi:trehalose 6-phosphate synthase